MKRILAQCLLGLTMLAAILPERASAAPAPEILERSSKWNVGFDAESCNVTAEFGKDSRKIALQMYFYGLSDYFELRLFGRVFRYPQPRRRITTDFGPDANPVQSEAILGTAGSIPMAIAGSHRLDDYQAPDGEDADPPSISPEQEHSVTYLDVRFGAAGPWRLQTGPMDKVMQIVRLCQADLVKSWGYDLESIKNFQRGARPVDQGSWLRPADFPSEMAMIGANALVQVRLDVSETGAVAGCHLQKPMNPKEFNDLTCQKLMRSAKFLPALDKDGKPARTLFVTRVSWRMQ